MRNLKRVALNRDDAHREAWRACAFLLADRLTPFVGVEHDGVRYVLSTHEHTGICFPTFVRGFFEEETVQNMLAALSAHAGIRTIKDLTVLEVGANIGTETVSFLVRHGVKRVIAIEPDAENVRFLRANLALNGVQDRVVIYEIALSDTDCTVVLEHSDENWGGHHVRVIDSYGPNLHDEPITSEVPGRRLDSLVEAGEIDLDDIGLVWIDAERHEPYILDGAKRLGAARIPIVTEYCPMALRQIGALDRFHALIAERYNVIVDLKEPAVALGAERVAELAKLYTDERDNCANLLLLSARGGA